MRRRLSFLGKGKIFALTILGFPISSKERVLVISFSCGIDFPIRHLLCILPKLKVRGIEENREFGSFPDRVITVWVTNASNLSDTIPVVSIGQSKLLIKLLV